jgi:hypothetical protein
MSERDERGSWVGIFVLGMIVGAVLTLGVVAALFVAYMRQAEALAK